MSAAKLPIFFMYRALFVSARVKEIADAQMHRQSRIHTEPLGKSEKLRMPSVGKLGPSRILKEFCGPYQFHICGSVWRSFALQIAAVRIFAPEAIRS
jgi:hypothetical protein